MNQYQFFLPLKYQYQYWPQIQYQSEVFKLHMQKKRVEISSPALCISFDRLLHPQHGPPYCPTFFVAAWVNEPWLKTLNSTNRNLPWWGESVLYFNWPLSYRWRRCAVLPAGGFTWNVITLKHKLDRLTSLDGMLTTPVDLLFSLNFLFSICPFPFLALGPELFFSLLLLGDGLSLSLSLQAMGLESGEAHWAFSVWGGAFFRLLTGVAVGAGLWAAAAATAAAGWCVSSSGLFRAVPEEDRATE